MKTESLPAYEDDRIRLFCGDVLRIVDSLPYQEIQTVVTSPTYWGKRQFTDDESEFGCESLERYVERNVTLYSSLLDKMRVGGSIFLVIQDSFMGSGVSRSHHNHWINGDEFKRNGIDSTRQGNTSSVTASHKTIKNKSLCGIPYRIALELVDRGYIWRQQIIWQKPNPMPENVSDRTWQSVEYILHFTNASKYKFNKSALLVKGANGKLRLPGQVMVAAPEPRAGHSATFPTKIVEKLLLSSSDEDDVVFEPFLGSGTMLRLSLQHRRRFIGCDICTEFVNGALNFAKNYRMTNLLT